jgi:hypothetical protein
MLQNLPLRVKAYLGVGAVLIVAVLLMPSGKDSNPGSGLESPKPVAAAQAAESGKPFLEEACPATPEQFAAWSGSLKARTAFQPLVSAEPPSEPPLPPTPEMPVAPLPLEPLRPLWADEQTAPQPDYLYTGWYRLDGQMVALIEDLIASDFYYLAEGESLGALTLVSVDPEAVVLRVRGREVRLPKTDEFVATPLNADAANTQTQRRGPGGRLAGFGPGGSGQRAPAPGADASRSAGAQGEEREPEAEDAPQGRGPGRTGFFGPGGFRGRGRR